ncbi:unnamed protein product, partial [Brassica rapa subsp. trilocularis]
MDNPATYTPPPPLKRNSNDVGWEYGLLCDPRVPDKVRCRLCGKEFSGGVYRMKEHIGHLQGNVSACPRSSKEDQEKCKNAIMEAKEKKNKKRKHEEAIRAELLWLLRHSNIPFNAIDSESFRLFCEALGQFGPGWIPPTQYQLK